MWQQSSWFDQGFAIISPQGYFFGGIWGDLAPSASWEGQGGGPPFPVTPRGVLEGLREETWLSQRPPKCCFYRYLPWDSSHKAPLCAKEKGVNAQIQKSRKLERRGVEPCLISSIQILPASAKFSLIARSKNITVLL